MKVLNKVMMGAAALVLLTGCSSMKSVDSKTFLEKATEAWKDVPYTEATINGSFEMGEQKVTIKDVKLPVKDGTLDMTKAATMEIPEERQMEYTIAATFVQVNAVVIGTQYASYEASEENIEVKFYVGNGFKVTAKDDKNSATMQFDKYGMLTKVTEKGDEAGNVSITVKYSK